MMLIDQHEMRHLTNLAVKLHTAACGADATDTEDVRVTVSANDLRRATCALLLALGFAQGVHATRGES